MDALDQIALACQIRAARLAVDWREHGRYQVNRTAAGRFRLTPGAVVSWVWNV